MTTAEYSGVLRDVAISTQVRALLHPGAPNSTPTGTGSVVGIAPGTSAMAAAGTAIRPAGYVDGFELGHREGRADGELEGARAAVARSDEALRRALEAHRRDADREAESSRAERSALGRRFERLMDDFQAAATERLHLVEDDAVSLAFEAICRLLGKGHGQAEQLAASITSAMGSARAQPILRIRVRPDGLALLSASPQGRALSGAFSSIEWLPDPRIEGDGCILDNALGSVDARMGIQLDRLRRLWSDGMRESVGDAPLEASR